MISTTKDTRISFRTNSELRDAAVAVFDSLQLDMSTALNMFLAQVVKKQTLPLDFDTRRRLELADFEARLERADQDRIAGNVYTAEQVLAHVAERATKYKVGKHVDD